MCVCVHTGARVKITRSFVWRNEEDEDKPWADLGAGINIDMDRQRIQSASVFANFCMIATGATHALRMWATMDAWGVSGWHD